MRRAATTLRAQSPWKANMEHCHGSDTKMAALCTSHPALELAASHPAVDKVVAGIGGCAATNLAARKLRQILRPAISGAHTAF